MLYSDKKSFLEDHKFSDRLFLQIKDLSFDTIFLCFVFDFIASQFVSQNFTLPSYSWQKIMTFALHRNLGTNVTLIFNRFNFFERTVFEKTIPDSIKGKDPFIVQISKKQDIINGTITAFSAWGGGPFFTERFPTKQNVIGILEFLDIPKQNIELLVDKSFEQKNLEPIVSFLKDYKWPSKKKQKISELKNQINYLKRCGPACANFEQNFSRFFNESQNRLETSNILNVFSSFEDNIMGITNFYTVPSSSQIYKDFILKGDPILIEIFELFKEEIYRRNPSLKRFPIMDKFPLITEKTMHEQKDKIEIKEFQTYFNLFLAESERLFESKKDRLQVLIERSVFSTMENTAKKAAFLSLMAVGFFLINYRNYFSYSYYKNYTKTTTNRPFATIKMSMSSFSSSNEISRRSNFTGETYMIKQNQVNTVQAYHAPRRVRKMSVQLLPSQSQVSYRKAHAKIATQAQEFVKTRIFRSLPQI